MSLSLLGTCLYLPLLATRGHRHTDTDTDTDADTGTDADTDTHTHTLRLETDPRDATNPARAAPKRFDFALKAAVEIMFSLIEDKPPKTQRPI